MHMPSLYVYIIMFQDTLSTTHDSSPPQEGWRTKIQGGKNQGANMIRKIGKGTNISA